MKAGNTEITLKNERKKLGQKRGMSGGEEERRERRKVSRHD